MSSLNRTCVRLFGPALAAAMLLAATAAGGGEAGAPAATAAASLPAQLVAAFDRLFKGPYAGERAIHAKGIVLRGTFAADPVAASLSTADHLRAGGPPLPVIVRFSDFSGVPTQVDGGPGNSPTGMAIKFLLPGGIDTDIVAHSYNGFPVGTPEDFLAYINALASPDAAAREAFFATHPAARRFFEEPKPTPASYGTETYYGVDAFRFTNAAGLGRFGRYRIEPAAGARYLAAGATAELRPDYLRDELGQRLNSGPISFRLLVQLAAAGDPVADPTTPWPADRPEILLGTLSLTQIADSSDADIRTLFFSPMNLVPGIAASDDPLLAARTRSYAISYRRRIAGE